MGGLAKFSPDGGLPQSPQEKTLESIRILASTPDALWDMCKSSIDDQKVSTGKIFNCFLRKRNNV